MNNSAICQKLDEAIENFMKDSSMFPEGSSEPVTKNDLHIFSVMVLNALGDVKKAFE